MLYTLYNCNFVQHTLRTSIFVLFRYHVHKMCDTQYNFRIPASQLRKKNCYFVSSVFSFFFFGWTLPFLSILRIHSFEESYFPTTKISNFNLLWYTCQSSFDSQKYCCKCYNHKYVAMMCLGQCSLVEWNVRRICMQQTNIMEIQRKMAFIGPCFWCLVFSLGELGGVVLLEEMCH